MRKLTEVMMAVLLDLHYEKDQILESYINEVYLGQDGPRSVHGFALASRHYFDAPLNQLGLHQQALLIGMIKGPSLYNPVRNPKRALERRNVVLAEMAQRGVISPEAKAAQARSLDLNSRTVFAIPFRPTSTWSGGNCGRSIARDLTTPWAEYFHAVRPVAAAPDERSTTAVLDQLNKGGALESASVVTRFDSGEVAALVGGRSIRYAGFNRALDAQAGGLFLKPAVYLAALEQPRRYSWYPCWPIPR